MSNLKNIVYGWFTRGNEISSKEKDDFSCLNDILIMAVDVNETTLKVFNTSTLRYEIKTFDSEKYKKDYCTVINYVNRSYKEAKKYRENWLGLKQVGSQYVSVDPKEKDLWLCGGYIYFNLEDNIYVHVEDSELKKFNYGDLLEVLKEINDNFKINNYQEKLISVYDWSSPRWVNYRIDKLVNNDELGFYIVVDRKKVLALINIRTREELFELFDKGEKISNNFNRFDLLDMGYFKKEKDIARLGYGSKVHAVISWFRELNNEKKYFYLDSLCGDHNNTSIEHSPKNEIPTIENVTCKKCLKKIQ